MPTTEDVEPREEGDADAAYLEQLERAEERLDA